MTKLTETQTIILSAGAQRTDNIALPLPKGLAGAAAKMAVTKMIEHGWLQEVDANLPSIGTETVVFSFKDVTAVGEAIEQGSRYLCITSGGFPFNEASIGGGRDADPFAEVFSENGTAAPARGAERGQLLNCGWRGHLRQSSH
jgi:hypothetical protein